MTELHFRKRKRLKSKVIKKLAQELRENVGAEVFSQNDTVDIAQAAKFDLIFVDGVIMGIVLDDKPFLTIRGLLAYKPERKWVTVDMGAVKFVYNGADVMAPGIIAADPGIKEGDMVWIRDEKNGQPFAIGRALSSGVGMVQANQGKAVKTLHHVGDDVWNYGTEN